MFYGQCLLIERDSFFLDRIQNEKSEIPFLTVRSPREGITVLSRPQYRIKAIFVSTSFGIMESKKLLSDVRAINEEIPVIYLCHHSHLAIPLDNDAAKNQVFQIENPERKSDLIHKLKELFPNQFNWQGIEASPEEKGQELQLKEEDFIGVKTEDFLLTSKSFFNVFLKMPSGKFVKILHAGDPLDSGLLEKYEEKNVTELWIKEEEHRRYTNLTEKTAAQLVKSNSGKQVTAICHLGDNVVRELTKFGIDDNAMAFADKFVGHSVAVIKRLRNVESRMDPLWEELLNSEHSTAVVVLSGLLANELGFESSKAIKLVGVAALLHDIALFKADPHFPTENEQDLSEEQKKIFKSHAKDGAEMLRKEGIFEEVVIQAVAQHHDRRKSLPSRQINLVSEIIGACDTFYHKVVKGQDEMAKRFFLSDDLKEFSPSVEKAFLKILSGSKTKKQA
ncbi:MAG: HD domain-containing protein [Bacteriovoracaceae bacterium]|nr:HD domain-containing protein [Bacteriovoracaceae bacterium]